MNPKTETEKQDVITIVAEPGALVFATRKEWLDVPEPSLSDLLNHNTDMLFYGSGGIYMLLRNMNPGEFLKDSGIKYRLVKIVVDEEGKLKTYAMNLSFAEALQLQQSRLTLWE